MKCAFYGLGVGFGLGLAIEVLEVITPLDLGADVPAWPLWLGILGLVVGLGIGLLRRRH